MHTSAIHSKSIEVPRMIFANNSASVSSNISSIHSSGMKETLPLNSEKNVSTGTPFMRKEDLHSLNNQEQAQKIAHLLGGDITVDMVKRALNFGGMGDLNQQAMNYRPESSLVVLTLLEPHEMANGLLASAAKMVKDLNRTTNDTYKVILKSSLKQFDKKLKQSLFRIKDDHFLIMRDRFKEIYIKPKFENILKPYLSENIIKQLSMDDCLLSLGNKCKQEEISVLNDAYQKEGNTPSVDKAHYMHSMFSILEESLEIIKTLKTTVDWQEHSPPSNLENSPLHVADEVDGAAGLPQSKTSSQHHISGSYNTTNNYYFSSPLSENITKIVSQNPEESQVSPEESKRGKQSEEPVLAPVKHQPIAKQPSATLSQPTKQTKVDDELPKMDNTIYQSKGFVVSTLRGNPPPVLKATSTSPSAKQDAIKPFLPKAGHLLGSYLKKGEGLPKVILSTEGALTRNQSDKDIYRGTREATKTVENTASYLLNGDAAVTLTERGALTRDQSKKDAYTTGQ